MNSDAIESVLIIISFSAQTYLELNTMLTFRNSSVIERCNNYEVYYSYFITMDLILGQLQL